MNSGKNCHNLVVNKNKLFVISTRDNDCEVYDTLCKKFITIKSSQFDLSSIIIAYSIENKIFILQENSPKIIAYDTNKNEWSEESYEFTTELWLFSSVKVPCL